MREHRSGSTPSCQSCSGKKIGDFRAQIRKRGLILSEIHLAVASDGDGDGILLAGIVHCNGALRLGEGDVHLLCGKGVMTMKMISSTSITSTIGVTLMLEFTLLPSFLFASAISICIRWLQVLSREKIRPLGSGMGDACPTPGV